MTPLTQPRSAGTSPWWSGRALLFALALLAILTCGCLPLVDEDEGEYSEVAVELAHSGQWLAPTLNGHAFYEKPILLFWLQAPLVQLAGSREWTFRLPSVLCTVAWGLILLDWWTRARGARAAALAVWLAVSCAGTVVVGRAATMDALMVLLLTLTLRDLWAWLDTGRRHPLRRAAVWAALGLLGKGPMAVVIPGLVLIAYAMFTPAIRARWRELLDPLAWLILLVVGLPWYVWYGLYSHGAFLDYFLLRENAGRLGGSLQGHGGSPLYYVLVLPLLLLPHGGVLVALGRSLRRFWTNPLERFLLLWFSMVFLLFTVAGTKLPHYLMYGCPPLFLLAGSSLADSRGIDRLRDRSAWLAGLLLPVTALLLPWLAARALTDQSSPYLRELLARGADVFDAGYYRGGIAWLLLALTLPLLHWAWRRYRRPAALPSDGKVVRLPGRAGIDLHWQVMVPGLLSALGISLVLLPALTGLQQDPVRHAAAQAARLGRPVVSDDRMPSFSVYLGHPTEVRGLRAGDIAFGRLDHPERLGQRYEVLFAEGGLRLVRVLTP